MVFLTARRPSPCDKLKGHAQPHPCDHSHFGPMAYDAAARILCGDCFAVVAQQGEIRQWRVSPEKKAG